MISQKFLHIYGNLYWGDSSDAKNEFQLNQLSISDILVVGHLEQPVYLDNFVYKTIDLPNKIDQSFDYFNNFSQTNNFLSMGNTLVQWVQDRQRAAVFVIAYLLQHEHFSLQKACELLLSKNIIIQALDPLYVQILKNFYEKVLKKCQSNDLLQKKIFDRQMNIPGWNQSAIKQQLALVLGVGGLGCVVLQQLLRLGIGKIIMVDYDTVELSNLPRQTLFGKADIGLPKIEAAMKNLSFENISATVIEGHQVDALKHWTNIVEMAKESTIVFNLIDHGDYWDLAVTSLCIKLGLPQICGGNYANSMMLDFYPPQGRPCYLCLTPDLKDKEVIDKLHPDNILKLQDISFCPPNDNPQSQTYPMLCTICAVFLANIFKCYVQNPTTYNKSKRTMFYLDDIESVNFEIERDPQCKYCQEKLINNSQYLIETTTFRSSKDEIWKQLQNLELNKVFPQKVENVAHSENAINEFIITFFENQKWTVQISTIDSQKCILGFNVIKTEPMIEFIPFTSYIQLQTITSNNQTLIKWESNFNKDITKSTQDQVQKVQLGCLQALRLQYQE